MAELIGIRLQLTGATQVAGGLSQITDALQDTAAQAGTTGAALKTLGAQAVTGVQATQSATQAVQQQLRASARETDAQANMLRQANRNLSMQMTDIVTSLSSGMPAHMVLIQQGGQIKDAYGGVLESLKGVGRYVATLATPVNLAAGAIAALGVAALKGSQEVDAYTRALTLTGNQIGMTEGQLAQMATRIDSVAGTTSKAAEVLAQLAGTAGITSDNIERIATASIAMERAGGPSVDELAKKFAALGEKPVDALIKLNEAENFLTESVYAQIRALTDQGREADAAAAAQAAYADVVEQRAQALESRLGYLERAWRGVKDFAKEAWDAMLGLGRKDTDEQRLDELRKQLDDRLKAQATARSDNRARYQPGIDLLKQQIAEIEKSLRLQKEQDDLRQKDLDRAKARASWDQERTKFLTQEKRLEEEIARIRKLGAEAGISKADIEARVRAARERLAPRSSSTRSGQKVSSVTELGDIDALQEAVALLDDGLEIMGDINDERERGSRLDANAVRSEKEKNDERKRGTRLQRDEQQLIEQYKRTVDSVGDALANALMNGGKSAGEQLKRYFSTLILQPIIRAIVDPVARTVTGVITSIAPSLFGSAAAAGTAGAAGAAGGLFSSPLSLLSSAYSAVTGSTASFLGGAAQSLGKMIGGGIGGSIGAFGAGMQGAVLAPGLAGPTTVGAGGAMGLGATLGAALPLIGLALGALWEPLFGRKLKDQGVEGSFGAGGFSGQQYQFFKGGLFRSNKTTRSALDPELQTLLSDTFLSARTSIATMARELGMATDALAGFSKDVKVSFMNLTQEQIQEKLAQELGLVADEMARLVAGAGATAESLQQLYQAVMSERSQLEQRLLQLQGDTAEIRRRERDGLHETNRALYDRITALEDEQAAVAKLNAEIAQRISTLQGELQQAESERLGIAQRVISERTALEQRLLQAQGNTAALRERELEALDPLNRAFARFVLAAEDAAAAAGTAAQNVAALAGAGQGIAEFVAFLRGAGSGGTASIASLRSTYAQSLSLAQAGDVGASGRIVGEARALIDATRARARSRAEADALAAQIATDLATLPATINYDKQQAEALQALQTHFTTVDKPAQEAIDGNTADTVTETEKTVAEMRVLVTETIVNSGKLTTLNTSIGSLTNALTAATEQQRVQREIELLQTQGTGAASALGRLSSQYETSRAEAMQRYVDIYSAGWPSEVLNYGLEGLTRGTPEYLEGLVNRLNGLNQATPFAFGTSLELPTSSQVQAGQLGYVARVTPGTAPQSYITTVQNALAGRTPLQTAAQELEALRQQIRDLGGVPAFAAGGMHSGGLRLVGERGPELEVTGPARYWSAADTTAMLGNSNRREEVLAAEIRALRAEVQGLRSEARATAENTGKTQRLMQRVTRDGESMQVTDVTPAP